jgi:pyridoxine 5-phosphate synthase
LYTERFAHKYAQGERETAIAPYIAAAQRAHELGLGVNAGHDLSLENIAYFKRQMPHLDEVSIGHALIAEALYLGLEATVKKYLAALS